MAMEGQSCVPLKPMVDELVCLGVRKCFPSEPHSHESSGFCGIEGFGSKSK